MGSLIQNNNFNSIKHKCQASHKVKMTLQETE